MVRWSERSRPSLNLPSLPAHFLLRTITTPPARQALLFIGEEDMTKIKTCICGGKPRLSKETKGIFKFVKIQCSFCRRRTHQGEYMWLSAEDKEACIKEWNDAVGQRMTKP